MHPFVILDHKNGGTNKYGQRMQSGDRVKNPFNNKIGTADEFLQDGDTYITYDDGTYDCVKWYHLVPEKI